MVSCLLSKTLLTEIRFSTFARRHSCFSKIKAILHVNWVGNPISWNPLVVHAKAAALVMSHQHRKEGSDVKASQLHSRDPQCLHAVKGSTIQKSITAQPTTRFLWRYFLLIKSLLKEGWVSCVQNKTISCILHLISGTNVKGFRVINSYSQQEFTSNDRDLPIVIYLKWRTVMK